MRRRSKKVRKRLMKRKRQKLDKIFDCILCYEEKCVEVKMQIIEGKGAGYLRCNQCEAKFESDIYEFSDKIDVYFDWVDKFDVTGRYHYSGDDDNLSIQRKSKSINSKGKSRVSSDLNTFDEQEYSQCTYDDETGEGSNSHRR
ncbi:Elf1-domain-containing protein [Gigaspora margarita]|uniref:Transcription elongation factor 1 homolog n=1 Tax=Gigaspora margarita TaxID=4874 RepID=A0A8H4EF58_GIGMA|nr:Elf1-domain-containing protein [Gigaspora margarita]